MGDIAARQSTWRAALAAALALVIALASSAAQAKEDPRFRPLGDAFVAQSNQLQVAGTTLWLEHRGVPVVHRSMGNVRIDSWVPIASASKWYSALVLARLVERGVLRWDSRVGEFFPQAPVSTHAITLDQLFSHTSGIPWQESACMANPDGDLHHCAMEILSLPSAYPPGTGFGYGSNSMQVAGRMAEIASGRAWDDLFRDEVAAPLGFRTTDFGLGTGRPALTRTSNPRIGGGARSTGSDYLQLLRMWRANGMHDGRRYLMASTVRSMERDRTAGLTVFNSPYASSGGYGFGFWRLNGRGEPNAQRIGSAGLYGFHPWIDRQADLIGVISVVDNYPRLSAAQASLQQQAADIVLERRTQAERLSCGLAGIERRDLRLSLTEQPLFSHGARNPAR